MNLSIDEWNELPWYVSTAYMEGLRKEGVIKDGSQAEQPPPIHLGTPSPLRNDSTVDYASDPLSAIPRGFKTRRAG